MNTEYLLSNATRSDFPRVAHLPNIVTCNTPDVLKYLLRAIDRKGGIMYEEPPRVEDGCEHFFTAWKRQENQRFLLDRGCFYPQFMLDAHTDITKLIDLEEQDGGDWNFLVNHIGRFRWFYAPIFDEESIAIFVTRELDRPWVERIAERFDHVGIPYAFVFDRNGQDVMKVPAELRRIWRLP